MEDLSSYKTIASEDLKYYLSLYREACHPLTQTLQSSWENIALEGNPVFEEKVKRP